MITRNELWLTILIIAILIISSMTSYIKSKLKIVLK